MREQEQHHPWKPSPSDLEGITPLRARDLVVRCLFEAQNELIARNRHLVDFPATEDEIRSSAVGALRMAFDRAGANYESPTKETLKRAIAILIERSHSLGAPPSIIEDQRSTIDGILALL